MAEEVVHHPVESSNTEGAETTDRGLFDFLGAKKEEEKLPTSDYQQAEQVAIASEFEDKVHVSEAEDKKPSLLSKLHRSGSSSSSSSSDEEEAKEGEEKKKKKKKSKEKVEDSSVPVEKIEEAEEKKGFLDKIKEKLPGRGHKEEVPPPPPAAEYTAGDGEPVKEKKGSLEKIKEKIPGYQPKGSDEDKKEKETYDH